MFRGTQIASLYKSFRPVYPPTLVQRILHFSRQNNPNAEFKMALDVGCGSGQLTSLLAPKFKFVLGTDESKAQIELAKEQNTLENVQFQVGGAEKMDIVENASVDLVTAAQCIHWIDGSKFYPEVKRVLKPKGTLAIITYRNPILVSSKNDEIISKKMTEISDETYDFFRDHKYMNARAAVSKYHGDELQVPFENVEKDSSLFMDQSSTINGYIGLVSSSTFYANFIKANPTETDFLEKLKERLLKVSGSKEDEPLLLKYPLDLTLACLD